MKKLLDFITYKHIQKMSYSDMNKWVLSVYKSGFVDGLEEGEKEVSENSDLVAQLTDDRLMKIILSVKGIGKNRAQAVIDKVLSEGIFDGTET